MDDLDRLSEDLFQKFWNGDDTDWDELARYVQRLLLEARIKECTDCAEWWQNDYGWKVRNHIEKLKSQLKKLEG